MDKFLDKLDNFLFDIIGLIFPGFILLSVLIIPFLIPGSVESSNNISSYISTVVNHKFSLSIIIIISYILGHVIKIAAIIFYEIMTLIFDNGINRLVIYIVNCLNSKANALEQEIFGKVHNLYYLKQIEDFLIKQIKRVFTFKSENYMKANELIKEQCLKFLSKTDLFPDEWYSIYKYSIILHHQEKIKSLTENYLSKYNLYRSLSLIFALSIPYYLYLNPIVIPDIKIENLSNISSLTICIILFGFWFAFHTKYKRYWLLCGNEALMSLYVYIKSNEIEE